MPEAAFYMLDSDVCIAALRHDANARRLPPPGRCVLSHITVAELWTGIEKCNRRDEQAARLEVFLSGFACVEFADANLFRASADEHDKISHGGRAGNRNRVHAPPQFSESLRIG